MSLAIYFCVGIAAIVLASFIAIAARRVRRIEDVIERALPVDVERIINYSADPGDRKAAEKSRASHNAMLILQLTSPSAELARDPDPALQECLKRARHAAYLVRNSLRPLWWHQCMLRFSTLERSDNRIASYYLEMTLWATQACMICKPELVDSFEAALL